MSENPLVSVIQESLDDLKALDVVTLHVGDMTPEMDYMVIATGSSTRQVKALINSVMVDAKAAGYQPISHEGVEVGDWALVDFGDVVVHAMLPDMRGFYDLERLWSVRPSDRSGEDAGIRDE